MIRVALPAALIVAIVAGYAGVATYNRGGTPVSVITVTERELALPWGRVEAPGDEPNLRLRLVVDEHGEDVLDALNWLTPERLTELGFDLSVPVGSPEAPQAYGRALPRPAWVVLEYDGPAWEARALRPAAIAAGARATGSRLVPVDAGLDVDALAARYPDGRHLVMGAIVDLDFVPVGRGGPLVHGVLRSLAPEALTVPPAARGVLAGLEPRLPERTAVPGPGGEPPAADPAPGAAFAPRYEVEIAMGRMGLPYIRAVRRTPPGR